MATPKVALRSAASSSGTPLYILDYRHNGKRIRQKVGSNKRDAELIRTKVEREILLGTYQVPSTKKSISLGGLIEEFLDVKKNAVRQTSLHRYKNYLDPLRKFFDNSFPAVTGDIALIETKYLRKFIDDAIQGKAATSIAWSKRTGNDAINIIRSLFKYAVEEEFLSKNPASKLEMMRTPAATKADYYTDDQLELIHLHWKAVNLTKGEEQITAES